MKYKIQNTKYKTMYSTLILTSKIKLFLDLNLSKLTISCKKNKKIRYNVILTNRGKKN